jgi:hypothetical protein
MRNAERKKDDRGQNSEVGMRNAEVEESAMVNENPQKMTGFGFEKCGSGF